ncbi:MAG: polyamine aminopropyltransferase [Syntrophomonadaceae bacterium]|nr:polyamine aminopropyltransferase [Syntrophomonadaceae bacterium]
MDLWFTEYQTPALGFSCKINSTLRVEQTPYQHLAVIDTQQFGRMLLLDGMVMTTDVDEYVYHEMIMNVALNSHPAPENILIIGGGDGGTLREAVRHPLVKKATLVEIDARVIEVSREYFPKLSGAFDHPKASVIVADGVEYVKEHIHEYDIIAVDSTEPVGPAIALFRPEFYRDCESSLKEDGMLVVQSESPFFNGDVIEMAYAGISQYFPVTKLYLASIPTYPSGLWSFTVGSKRYDPERPLSTDHKLRYYNPEIHRAAFVLPGMVRGILAGISTSR